MEDLENEDWYKALATTIHLNRRELLALLALAAADGAASASEGETRYAQEQREFLDHLMSDRSYERHSAVDATLKEAHEAPFRDAREFYLDRNVRDPIPSPVTTGDNVFAAVHHAHQRIANNNFNLPEANDELHQALLALATQIANPQDPHNKSWARSNSRGPDPAGPHCTLLLNEELRNVGMDPLMQSEKDYARSKYLYDHPYANSNYRPSPVPRDGLIGIEPPPPGETSGHVFIVAEAKGKGISAGSDRVKTYQHFEWDAETGTAHVKGDPSRTVIFLEYYGRGVKPLGRFPYDNQ
jgi:hypothetical protein